MDGYEFTERMRVVLAMAREEAETLNHEYVGTEHLLLALVHEGDRSDSQSNPGIAITTLRNLGVDPGAVAKHVLGVLRRGQSARVSGPGLPYTSRARRVLELAMKEARELGHSYVGTEHLLLGLLREEKGIAAQVLTVSGARLDHARAEVLRLLGLADSQMALPEGGVWVEGVSGRRIDSVEISLRFHDGEIRQRSFATPREAAEYLWRGGAS